MTANTFAPSVAFLDECVANFEAEAHRVSQIALEVRALTSNSMTNFTVTNARAIAARRILTHLNQYSREEERPRLIRKVQSLMDSALENKDTHIASIVVFNEVLKSLRGE